MAYTHIVFADGIFDGDAGDVGESEKQEAKERINYMPYLLKAVMLSSGIHQLVRTPCCFSIFNSCLRAISAPRFFYKLFCCKLVPPIIDGK